MMDEQAEHDQKLQTTENDIMNIQMRKQLAQTINEDLTNAITLQRLSYRIQEEKDANLSAKQLSFKILYKQSLMIRSSIFTFYILMSFLQKPSWCNSRYYDLQNKCQPLNSSTKIPLSFYFIPNSVYYTLEITIMIFTLIIKSVKLYYSHNKKKYLKVYRFSIVVSILIIFGDIFVLASDGMYNFVLSNFLKPVFVILFSQMLRSTFILYIKVFLRAKGIIYLMFFNILLFAGIGRVLFYDFCNEFRNIWSGIYFLYVLQTTVSFPDAMLPFYDQSKPSFIFFVVFLLINTILIVNMVIGVFYSSFKSEMEKQTFKILSKNKQNITDVTSKFFMDVEQSKIRSASAQSQDLVQIQQNLTQNFKISNYVKYNDFIQVYKFMDNQYFEILMEILSLINFYLIYLESQLGNQIWMILNLSVNLIFFIEEILLISCLGSLYFKKISHYFDLFVTFSLIIFLSIDLTLQKQLVRVILILMVYRIGRIMKLVLRLKQFQQMLVSFFALIPQLMVFFGVLLVLFQLFIAFGEQFFGGKMNSDVVKSLQAQNITELYIYVNFNDFGSSFMTCFALLIVNNWNQIAKTYQVVTSQQFTALYFVIFHIIVVLLALNITIAFMIDYLVKRFEKFQEKKIHDVPKTQQYIQQEKIHTNELKTPLQFPEYRNEQ